jgi:hypothetical protein
MAEFYEFHDSILEGIESSDGKLVLRFKAYLHLQPNELDERSWTGWTQRIAITVDNPVVESAFNHFPVQIYDGSLEAANLEARPEDIVGTEIPASLCSTSKLEIKIFGCGSDGDEYKDMVIRGTSAGITSKKEPIFVEKWLRDGADVATLPRLIGVGEFDSGLPDLATNKKYMEGFGSYKKSNRNPASTPKASS